MQANPGVIDEYSETEWSLTLSGPVKTAESYQFGKDLGEGYEDVIAIIEGYYLFKGLATTVLPEVKIFAGRTFDDLWQAATPMTSSNRAVIKEMSGSASKSFDDLVRQSGGRVDDIVTNKSGSKSFTDKDGITSTLRNSTDGDGRRTISQTGKDANGYKIQKKIRFDNE